MNFRNPETSLLHEILRTFLIMLAVIAGVILVAIVASKFPEIREIKTIVAPLAILVALLWSLLPERDEISRGTDYSDPPAPPDEGPQPAKLPPSPPRPLAGSVAVEPHATDANRAY